jgi:quercetin dioxygenase-like cupin family protein
MDAPQKIDWSEQDFAEVRPRIFGATVHTPQLTATLYRYGAGSSWEEHRHLQDQITTVLEGEIDFVVAGELVHLGAGQLATLPGGTPHSATVPESGSGAVTLNVFTHRDSTPGVEVGEREESTSGADIGEREESTSGADMGEREESASGAGPGIREESTPGV